MAAIYQTHLCPEDLILVPAQYIIFEEIRKMGLTPDPYPLVSFKGMDDNDLIFETHLEGVTQEELDKAK